MSVLVAPFDVSAPPKRVGWVRSAIASLDPDVNPALLLPRTVPLIFGTVKKVPGEDYFAAGYTLKGPETRVRHGMAGTVPKARDLDKPTTEYVVLHEGFGHARLALRPLSRKNWRALKALVKGPAGTTYWHDVLEVIIDAAIEAISSVVSPYKYNPATPNKKAMYKRWIDDADLPKVKALWLADATPAPTPDPEPVPEEPAPLPEPVDPRDQQIAQLTAALQAQDAAITRLNERIAAKDKHFQEGLAA